MTVGVTREKSYMGDKPNIETVIEDIETIRLPNPFGHVYPVRRVSAKKKPVQVSGYGIGKIRIEAGETKVFRVRWRRIRVNATCGWRNHASWVEV